VAVTDIYVFFAIQALWVIQVSPFYLDVHGAGDDAVDGGLGERVELAVFATHEVRLEDVATAAVVLERAEVQLHRQVYNDGSSRHL